jgi:RNA polymerase sigma-70 factor (ECF subfamily)
MASSFAEWLERARRADRSALDQLLGRWRPLLWLQARAVLRSELSARVDPSDIVQETLTQAFEDLPKFRGQTEAQWGAWLRSMVAGHAAKVWRYHSAVKRDFARDLALTDTFTADQTERPEGQAIDQEEAALLAEAIAKLPDTMREVVVRRAFDGQAFVDGKSGQLPDGDASDGLIEVPRSADRDRDDVSGHGSPRRQDFGLQVGFSSGTRDDWGVVQLVADDPVSFRVEAERDCYVGLWTVDHEGTVVQLFPNKNDLNHLVRAGERRIIAGIKAPSQRAPSTSTWWDRRSTGHRPTESSTDPTWYSARRRIKLGSRASCAAWWLFRPTTLRLKYRK